jgi:DNA-binding protein YbaB
VTDPPQMQTPDAATVFASLDDRGKRAFCENELDEVYDGLDKLIQAISAIKVGAEDPDGVVQLTLGCDGRLLKLWIDPGATNQFTNLELEKKVSETIRDGLDEIARARTELNAAAIDYLPPG